MSLAQPLAAALRDLAMQSGVSIMADAALTQGKSAPRYVATSNVESALATLLRGTGLTYRRRGDLYVVVSRQSAKFASGTILKATMPVAGKPMFSHA